MRLRVLSRDHTLRGGGRRRTTCQLAFGARNRFGQPLGLDRLEQIVDGVHGEGLDRVLGVGGDEHDHRRALQRGQQVEAVGAAEIDVEEDQLRRGARDGLHRVGHALGLAHDLDRGMVGQQATHRLARQMLVIDNQNPEQGSPTSTRAAITVSPRLPNVNL